MRDIASIGSAYTAATRVGHFGVQGGAIVELADSDQMRKDRRGRLRTTTAAVLGGSQLTHPASTTASQFGLELIVEETLTVDATSRIDVNARGYLGGRSGGNSGNEAVTLGNTSVGGSAGRNGGSYGGSGAFGSASGTVNPLYGNADNPNDPGSGGGSDSGAGGNGGGLIRLSARTLQLDGTIGANGGNGGFLGGGGSGGAIWLSTRTLAGAGALQASGGNGDGYSGGGGGGRIAIYYEVASAFDLGNGNVAVTGGLGLGAGGNGSVFLQQTNFSAPTSVGNLFIAKMEKSSNTAALKNLAGQAPTGQWILECVGPANERLVLEISTDLVHWREVASTVEETGPGIYRMVSWETEADATFFRLRLKAKILKPSRSSVYSTVTTGSPNLEATR
jgi:hypothetical protein